MPRLSTTARWAAAAALTLAVDGERRDTEIAQRAVGLPDLETLFTYMRDAELRFETLRLRLEERLAPDASIPDSAFSLSVPASAAMVY